jgi:hypothetical protein
MRETEVQIGNSGQELAAGGTIRRNRRTKAEIRAKALVPRQSKWAVKMKAPEGMNP